MKPVKPLWTGELVFQGAKEDDRQGRTVAFRLVRPRQELPLANPFSQSTRRRRGHAGSRFTTSLAPILPQDKTAAMKSPALIDLMLLNWSDGPKGSTATFLVGGDSDEHPFMACVRGETSWMAAFIEIDENEQPVPPDEGNEPLPVEGGKHKQPLSVQAALLTKQPAFLHFVSEQSSLDANSFIKNYCGVNSKAEIKEGTRAGELFVDLRRRFGAAVSAQA